jgi:F-type H+-transporting ATPase subunit alpha
MVELLKQGQFAPLPVEQQVISIWAGTNGYLDDVPVGAVRRYETEWLAFVASKYGEVAHNIRSAKSISPEDEKRLHEAAKAFKSQFKA